MGSGVVDQNQSLTDRREAAGMSTPRTHASDQGIAWDGGGNNLWNSEIKQRGWRGKRVNWSSVRLYHKVVYLTLFCVAPTKFQLVDGTSWSVLQRHHHWQQSTSPVSALQLGTCFGGRPHQQGASTQSDVTCKQKKERQKKKKGKQRKDRRIPTCAWTAPGYPRTPSLLMCIAVSNAELVGCLWHQVSKWYCISSTQRYRCYLSQFRLRLKKKMFSI